MVGKLMKFDIGEWKMRNGEKAVVTRDDGTSYVPLSGRRINGELGAWHRSGRWLDNAEHDYDLIEPWVEADQELPKGGLSFAATTVGTRGEIYAATPLPPVEVKTLRDEFAMAALIGMARLTYVEVDIAKSAYAYADAMMEARKCKA